MAITAGTTAIAAEVKPQLYYNFRDLIDRDKHYTLCRDRFMNNYFVDGFIKSTLVASSTNWTSVDTAGVSRPNLYWTTTNGAELIMKTTTFPSTISYGTAYVDFWVCETIDEFNDSSFDTAVWDNTTLSANSTTTEDTAEVRLRALNNSGGGATNYIRTDNTMLDSTHRYAAVKWRWTQNHSGGSGTTASNSTVTFRVDDASTQVTLFSMNYNDFSNSTHVLYTASNILYNMALETSTSSLGLFGAWLSLTHLCEFFYNPDADVVFVYVDGMYYDMVAVNTVGNLRLGAEITATYTTSSGSPITDASLYLDWFRREDASVASSLATSLSADAGSNYTSVTRESEASISNTGTQFKMKNVATISGSEYIHVRGVAAFVR